MKRKGSSLHRKKGSMLTENVIFLVLNLTFFAIMALFILKQSSGSAYYEQAYAKQIALLIDSAKPGTQILLDFEKGVSSNQEWFNNNFQRAVTINGNIVEVRLSEGEGFSYSFFNEVKPGVDVLPSAKVFIVINKND
ncbi:MAG TPA: hypothetical protein VJH92_06610 [Candidatus Nanoarchaeia archaeon]|nr:hypothetical protein [Candidatus Nanoarchaeia archaeon]